MANGIKSYQLLFNASTATSGTWFNLDPRYAAENTRTIQYSMNAADSLKVEVTTYPNVNDGVFSASDYITLTTLTGATSGSYNIVGAWQWVRITKVGIAGNAKVQGII